MKTKKVTRLVIIICMVLLAAVVILFATSMKKDEGDTKKFDVPDIVLECAQEWVAQIYDAQKNSNNYGADYDYSDWRIENLEHSYTYEDFGGMVLEVYNLNYEFLSDSPEDVQLWGGMYMTDEGWVCPGYPNSRYLIFKKDGTNLTYLTSIMENDCFPGDVTFTYHMSGSLNDIQHDLNENQTILAYIEGFDGETLTFDVIEWVQVPSERATELGISEEDAPSGFNIYNEIVTSEKYLLSDNCICLILDWGDSFAPMEISTAELADILEEREGRHIPYHLTIKNGEIVRIMERYVS